jgi:ABC-type sugar transport system substrate-binding protein
MEMKRLSIVLAVIVVASLVLLAACGAETQETTTQPPATGASTTGASTTGAPTTQAATGEKELIGVCLPGLDNPLMLEIKETFETNFGDKYDVKVSSADGNANTQAAQVENYTAMHAKFIFAMAVEATSLLPKLEAARAAGVLVMVAGGEPGETGRDAVMKMDQFLAGEYCALLAKNWVDETYPGAAAGSIETAVFISSLTTEAVQRTNGLLMIGEPYLKDWEGAYIDASGAPISDKDGKYLVGKSDADQVANPVYCPAAKIVQKPTAEMFQAGQTAMQNVLTTNPDVKVVLAYASDGGAGASQAIMDEFAKGAGSVVKDLSKVGVFGVGMFGSEADEIMAAANGQGVLRGVIAFGGGDLQGKTAALATKMLNGEQYPEVTWDELALVTVVNGKVVETPMANQGVISITPAGSPTELTTTTVAAATGTTVADGIYFEDQGNNVVKITDVFGGQSFSVHTSGAMACTIEAFDASGASLGQLQTDDGMLDYSSVADTVAKIVVSNPHGTVAEYLVP